MDVPQMQGNPMQAPMQDAQMPQMGTPPQNQENPQDTAQQEQSIQDQLDSIDKADQMDGAGVDTSNLPQHVMQAEDPLMAHISHIEEQLAAIDQADQMHELANGPGIQQIIEQSNQSMQDTMGGYTQMVSDNITQSLEHVATGISANNAAIADAISSMSHKVEEAIAMASIKDTSEATPGVTPAQLSALVKEIKSSIGSLAGKISPQTIDLGPITERLKSIDSAESKPEVIDFTPFIKEMKSSIDALPAKMPQPASVDMDGVISGLKKVQSSIENMKFPVQRGASGSSTVSPIKLGGSLADWKDAASYGDGVISGIGAIANLVWNGTSYDRVPGNAVSGLAINISQSPFQKLIDESGAPATTYVGQSAAGTAQGTATWTIERITVSGTTTTIQHATGTWTGRAALSYT